MVVDNNNRKTGFDFLDNLSAEDKRLAIKNLKRYWQSLTPQRREEDLQMMYAMVRQKLRQHNGMITFEQAVEEYVNVDFPKAMREAAQEMEQSGYFDIARSLRQTRWGVDKFAIEVRLLIDDDGGSMDGQVSEN